MQQDLLINGEITIPKNPTQDYCMKVISTPIKTRFYIYEKPVRKGFEKKLCTSLRGTEGTKAERNLQRARDNIMDTINANITRYSKFITLTSAVSCLDRDLFLTWFKTFKLQFLRKFGYPLPSVGVLERQTERGKKEGNKGSWHIHLAVFIQGKLDLEKLISCWTRGHLDIEVVRWGDIGLYMMKYLTADDQNLEFNKKVVLKSGNLAQPSYFETLVSVVPSEYDYIKTYSFYQGNFLKDELEGSIDPEKFNSCTLYELHHVRSDFRKNIC